ncbi:PTS system fructose-specific IIC component [Nesterenkonia lacusekhoensis]|uniref:PTS system fructose-specific IIC component n=2 Tax=Nesterenkonia lacusekhoensis TaxID=150832 RepID=A0ABS4SYL5_9MICC|nr:fructose-specific PTS transporter subunit EIIC [Nesterenkonia lacusekhoensis]MBP2317218.1 PTS system fructose-specific IIC component [Nesterenkonia lacusekhoensis]
MTIITEDLVSLDTLKAETPREVIRAIAEQIAAAGRTDDAQALFDGAWAREESSATGMPGGFAIPHCRTSAVEQPTVAFARLATPVDFDSGDGDADLVFFIAVPDGADTDHLSILSTLATSLMRDEFVQRLRSTQDAGEVAAMIQEAADPSPAEEPNEAEQADASASGAAASADAASDAPAPARTVVAVTACPTGIAHTYMAADALKQAAQRLGVDLHVETQGSAGSSALDPQVISRAEAVIFAADVDVRQKDRFAGKPVVTSRVKRGIDEPEQMLQEALAAAEDPQAQTVSTESASAEAEEGSSSESFGRAVQRVLMTGVSYMIPFVAAGGLLMALGFLLGGYTIDGVAEEVALNSSLWNLPTADQLPDPFLGWGALGGYLGSVFFLIGSTAMSFLVPALAGYIAYGMADRPGIAPGFTAGAIAVTMDAGFIGGIAGGVLAGLVAAGFRRLSVPRWLAGLMPVVIIPLCASIAAGGLMLLVLGAPIASLTASLETWLASMTGSAAILLGIVLGLMMCVDLGGPVNKVAYSFAVAGVGAASTSSEAPLMIMATVMAAGMVPPLGLALATFLRGRLFTAAERENGKTAVLLGAAFISEGAIPFAAADPLRVLPAAMAGGATTGALSMAFGTTSMAPHGGVFVLFAIDPWAMFLVAVLAGAVVTALSVIALKQWTRPAAAQPGTETAATTQPVAS